MPQIIEEQPHPSTALPSDTVAVYLDALVQGQRSACRSIVEDLLANDVRIQTLHVELFQYSLYVIGDLWESGKVTVATEHMATAITESLLTLIYPRLFAQAHLGYSAVVCCAASEFHHIGGKIVADTFELNRWHGYFLGGNTGISDLMGVIDQKRPDVVALSLALPDGIDALLRTAQTIRAGYPSIPIWVGGQAFRWTGVESLSSVEGVEFLSGVAELERRLQTWPSDHG